MLDKHRTTNAESVADNVHRVDAINADGTRRKRDLESVGSPAGSEKSQALGGGQTGAEPPVAPLRLKDVDVATDLLNDLCLKYACSTPLFTTRSTADTLCLATGVVSEVLEQLRSDKLIDLRGQKGPLNDQFAVTQQGMDRGARLLQTSAYVGAAPVSLNSYIERLQLQLGKLRPVTPDQVAASLAGLVLPELAVKVAGLAMSSRRSLLVFGPPGNGKTSLGRLLHGTVSGEIWVPRTIAVGGEVIRMYDPECHQRITPQLPPERLRRLDKRWVCIHRPFVMVGGELTLSDLELGYSDALGCYEAPVHVKANGGTFLLDDLGCQREDPERLLKRWFVPLDQKLDYLTLRTGQKVRVPFELMLIISTNLSVNEVMTPAILRRMGYRLQMGNPSAERYREIFASYAERRGCHISPESLRRLLSRYESEDRPLRGCEPHDLIERASDICRYQGRDLELADDVLDLAWKAYFSE